MLMAMWIRVAFAVKYEVLHPLDFRQFCEFEK